MDTTEENPTNDAHDNLLTTPISQVEEQQILKFAEDGFVEDSGPVRSSLMSYANLINDAKEHSVKNFLERPIAMLTGELKPGDKSFRLENLILPSKWWQQPMISEKLSGFRYLRCDFEVRLQVNAQPSNAGGLIMYFVPADSDCLLKPAAIELCTGYRHVILDFAQSTSAVLNVPYMALDAAWDMTGPRPQLGSVIIGVFSGLVGGGNTVDYTLYCRAKNITLGVPTGLPFVPLGEEPENSGPAQMAKGKAKETEVMTEQGPITKALDATSKVAGALGDVPVIGSSMGTLSWLTSIAAGVAGMFGWSRPQDESTQMPMQLSYMRTMANFNGDSKAKTLALDSRNAIRIPHELFQTEADEMSISHVVSTPIAIQRFTMKSSDQVGTTLWQTLVGAGPEYDPTIDHFSQYTVNPSYIDFVSNLFEVWRGEIVYTFKIFKTPLHSARLRITYVPGAVKANPSFDVNKCYSEIFDIRERTDIQFCVPYAYHRAWCSKNNWTGMVIVQVQNVLRNPSICDPSIEFVVYKHAGPDFQFAYPSFTTALRNYTYLSGAGTPITVVGPTAPWDGNTGYPKDPGQIEIDDTIRENGDPEEEREFSGPAQMEQRRDPPLMRECEDLFKLGGMPEYDANQMSYGEAVTSFRQLAKRYELYSTNPVNTGGKPFIVWPHVLSQMDPDKFINRVEYGFDSTLGYLSLIYRFQCGSMIVAFHRQAVLNSRRPIIAYLTQTKLNPKFDSMYRPKYTNVTAAKPGFAATTVSQPEESVFEIRVPHYYRWPARYTAAYAIENKPEPNTSPFSFTPGIYVTGMTSAYMSRTVGEDFSLGYLLPPPQMIIGVKHTSSGSDVGKTSDAKVLNVTLRTQNKKETRDH